MRKLYIHIGAEKTGTTTIQEVLYQNSSVLKSKGFYFVQALGNRNNRELASLFIDENKNDGFFISRGINDKKKRKAFKSRSIEKFEREISSLSDDIHSVIVTSEHFHSRLTSIDEIENSLKLFEKYFKEIKIICYVREQASTCASLYSTVIKSGSTIGMNDFIKKCHPDNVYYNYYDMLKKWSYVYGKNNLTVIPFDKRELFNQDLVDDFFSHIDCGVIPLINKNVEILNESLSTAGQYIARAINKALPRYLDDGAVNLKRVSALNQVYIGFKGKGQNMTVEEYKSIYESFNQSNIQLNNEFVSGKKYKDNCFLFSPPEFVSDKAFFSEKDVEGLKLIIEEVDKGSSVLNDEYAVLFRDLALEYEEKDFDKSILLMKLARDIRPNGPLINKFLKEKGFL